MRGNISGENHNFCENSCKSWHKSHLNSPKKLHVDDMMIHNFVKYFVQTRFYLWDIKITNLKPESCPDDLLEICYFISHKQSWFWTRYFARLCIIMSSTCVIFLVNLDEFFIVACTDFHEDCGFHRIRSLFKQKVFCCKDITSHTTQWTDHD